MYWHTNDQGEFITRKAALYTREFNYFLMASLISAELIDSKPKHNDVKDYMTKLGYRDAVMPITYATRLANIPQEKEDEERHVLGGMRNTEASY